MLESVFAVGALIIVVMTLILSLVAMLWSPSYRGVDQFGDLLAGILGSFAVLVTGVGVLVLWGVLFAGLGVLE